MDPDAALREIRELCAELADVAEIDHEAASELVSRVTNLDDWIKGGGYLPADWDQWQSGRTVS